MRPSILASLAAALSFGAAVATAPAPSWAQTGAQTGAQSFVPLANIPDNQQVRVLVSGWVPFTDMPVGLAARQQALAAQAKRTQDGVQQALGTAANTGSVRHYKYLPVAAVYAPARAVRALQVANPRVHIELDADRGLLDSAPGGAGRAPGGPPPAGSLTGKGQLVAELDSGVDGKHPFLAGKLVQEACFSSACPNGKDTMFGPGAAHPLMTHGTHVAGIMVGHDDTRSGVAPEAGLVAVQVFRPLGEGFSAKDSDVLAGLDYVVQLLVDKHMPIAAINMSLGGGKFAKPCGNSVYESMAKIVIQAGSILVAAAGNEGLADAMGEPACAPHVVSVGAVDKNGAVAGFSDSAPFLTMLAPGVDIVSSVGAPGPIAFDAMDGTSMAAPHVAAAFAVLRQETPNAAPEDLIQRLLAMSPRVADPRNGVRTPLLRVPLALIAGKPPPGPGPIPVPEQPPAPAGWTAITQ